MWEASIRRSCGSSEGIARAAPLWARRRTAWGICECVIAATPPAQALHAVRRASSTARVVVAPCLARTVRVSLIALSRVYTADVCDVERRAVIYVLLIESSTTVSAGRSGAGGRTLEKIPSPDCCRWVKDGLSTAQVLSGAGSLRGACRRSQLSFGSASGSTNGPISWTTRTICESDAEGSPELAAVSPGGGTSSRPCSPTTWKGSSPGTMAYRLPWV